MKSSLTFSLCFWLAISFGQLKPTFLVQAQLKTQDLPSNIQVSPDLSYCDDFGIVLSFSSDQLVISTNRKLQGYLLITLHDSQGRVVWGRNMAPSQDSLHFSINYFESGPYYLQISDMDGNSRSFFLETNADYGKELVVQEM